MSPGIVGEFDCSVKAVITLESNTIIKPCAAFYVLRGPTLVHHCIHFNYYCLYNTVVNDSPCHWYITISIITTTVYITHWLPSNYYNSLISPYTIMNQNLLIHSVFGFSFNNSVRQFNITGHHLPVSVTFMCINYTTFPFIDSLQFCRLSYGRYRYVCEFLWLNFYIYCIIQENFYFDFNV